MKTKILAAVMALAAVVLGVMAQGQPERAGVLSVLSWEPSNPWEELAGFNVYLAAGGASAGMVWVQTNRLELTNIMKALPNGVYQVNVTAVNHADLESAQSEPFYFFWYGHPPQRPTNLVVEFKR